MSNVIRFPRPSLRRKRLSMPAVERGIAEAKRRGIDPEDIKAATLQDCWQAGFLFSLLGSAKEEDQRGGDLGLRRLIQNTYAA